MSPRSGHGRRHLAIASVLVAIALAALVSLAPSLYEIEAKGKGPPIVPYEGAGLVYKVRVLDLFTLRADAESRPSPDKLSSTGLVAAASMALMTLLLLRAVGGDPRRRRFYALGAAGLAYLAADELFAFHETIGHNLQFLADLPGVERPDDVVFLSYAVPLAIFAWAFRDILLANRRAVQLFAVGTCFFIVAAAADLAGVSIDEPAEVVAAICLLTGLVLITADILRQELALDRTRGRRFVRRAESEPRVLSAAPPG
ncbi:MAG: hypothetical protein QOD71_1086 [Thermoleophilaceae bacterium]|jgi:hypothetical protein|nr:hypothetical protein [Thermoleophilaceae bacterium]